MKRKKHLITFSGGKDSLATIVWAMHNLEFDQWDVVFCDTGWESKITYEYVDWIETVIGKKFIRLKTKLFDNKIDEEILAKIIEIFGSRNVFAEMVINKQRFPSTKARFCTEKLKAEPMIDHVLIYEEDIVVVQGVRAEESQARRNLTMYDDYFKFYFEPYRIKVDGRKLYHKYRKPDVEQWCDKYLCDVYRPILKKTVDEVFAMIFDAGLKPNPLYFKGNSRVGCFPCVMCRIGEVKLVSQIEPERIEQLAKLEELTDSTFFPPEFIPQKYCTKVAMVRIYRTDLVKFFSKEKDQGTKIYGSNKFLMDANTGRREDILYDRYFKNDKITVYIDDEGDEYVLRKMKVPTVKDVVRYVSDDPNQTRLFEQTNSCVSVYNICE